MYFLCVAGNCSLYVAQRKRIKRPENGIGQENITLIEYFSYHFVLLLIVNLFQNMTSHTYPLVPQ
jgi:hypothetical protein